MEISQNFVAFSEYMNFNKCGLLYATYLPKTEHHRSIAAQNVAKAFLKSILFWRSSNYIVFISHLTKYLTKWNIWKNRPAKHCTYSVSKHCEFDSDRLFLSRYRLFEFVLEDLSIHKLLSLQLWQSETFQLDTESSSIVVHTVISEKNN